MVPRRPPSGVPSARVSVPRPRIALTGALAVLATAAAVANRQGAGPSAPAAVAGLAVALCAAGFGSLTFAALREGFSLAPRNLLALSAAMVAAAVAAGLPLWLAEHRGPWVARGSRVGGSWLDGSRPGGSGVGERRGRGAPGSWPAVALGRALGLALDLSLGL